MSTLQQARKTLDYLMTQGVVASWTDEEVEYGTRFIVIGDDGVRHVYRPKHVAAFYAGFCAGRTKRRAEEATTG